MENARGNKDGAWKREGKEEEARNRGRTKAGGCSLGLEKRPAKKEAGGARTGNAAQGTRKCTEVVEGAKEETAARRFPTKPINKKVAQIRTLHSEETREEEEATRRKRDRETERRRERTEQRRQRSGGHVASRRRAQRVQDERRMHPSFSSYGIDNSCVARDTRLYIPFQATPSSIRSNTSLFFIPSRFPFPLRDSIVRVAVFTKARVGTPPPATFPPRVSLFSHALFAFSTCFETRITRVCCISR